MVSKTGRITIAFFGFMLAFAVAGNAQVRDPATKRPDVRVSIGFCDLDVPQFWKQANADFYVMYAFNIDSGGKVVKLNKLRDDVVGVARVRECVENWRIEGIDTSRSFGLVLRWQHGKGWVEQELSSSGFRMIFTSVYGDR